VFKDAVDDAVAGSVTSASNTGALQVTSIAFDDTGERCLTSGEDEVFTLYDARKGK
jgi:COMPASS component SWD2